MFQYTPEEIQKIKDGIKALAEKNTAGRGDPGFTGGVYCGYLRALNDVRCLFLDLDLNKMVELLGKTSRNVTALTEEITRREGARSV